MHMPCIYRIMVSDHIGSIKMGTRNYQEKHSTKHFTSSDMPNDKLFKMCVLLCSDKIVGGGGNWEVSLLSP
jgi:hypothetical protein